jgi:hypothetical protein
MVNKNMDEKDITKLLGIKGKIRLSGKKTFLMASGAISKFRNNRAEKLSSMKELVKEEESQIIYDKNNKDVEKVNNITEAKNQLLSKETPTEEEKLIIEELSKEEQRLNNKVIKRINKGLGIFAIKKLYIKKMINAHREERKAKKFDNKFDKTITDIATDFVRLQEIKKSYDELSELFIKLNEKARNGEDVNMPENTSKLNSITQEYYEKMNKYKDKKKEFFDFCIANGMTEEEVTEKLNDKVEEVIKTIEEDKQDKKVDEEIAPKPKENVDQPYNGYDFGIVDSKKVEAEATPSTTDIPTETAKKVEQPTTELDEMLKQLDIKVLDPLKTNTEGTEHIPFGNGHSTR